MFEQDKNTSDVLGTRSEAQFNPSSRYIRGTIIDLTSEGIS